MRSDLEQDLRTDVFRRVVVAGLATLLLPTLVSAKVFHARDEALQLAFPGMDRVEVRDVYLTTDQHDRIEKMAKAPLDTNLVTLYVGWKGDVPSGYAIFDTHVVRTSQETFLVLISPEGTVVETHILAFNEPEEYLPTVRWLDTFKGTKLSDDLQVGRGVAAITGSTFSTRAVTSGIRRVMAIWNVVVGGK